MKLQVINIEGKKTDHIELSDQIFSAETNKDMIHSIVLIQKNAKNIKRVTTIEKNKKLIAATAEPAAKTKDKGKVVEKKATPEKKPEKKEVKK